jgi:hypothetical protein
MSVVSGSELMDMSVTPDGEDIAKTISEWYKII